MSEKYIPIIQITNKNFISMWPAISKAISESSYVALDCELSGLGTKSKLNSSEIDIRYTNLREITQEYSIVSLGVSCFKCQFCSPLNLMCNSGENSLVNSHSYLVQTFNILTSCLPKYSIEMRSMKFLLSHGFDFNEQYAHGLQYERGEDKEIGKKNSPLSVKKIFHLIIQQEKPIVLHNGFADLLFLYQSFYTDLPKNIESFAADLLQMFPSGIYDTKYISEYHQSFRATYLEFVFKYLQIENDARMKSGDWHCRFKFMPYPQNTTHLKWYYYLQVFDEVFDQEEESKPLCDKYKYHGWCPEADSCTSSHNINRIVRELMKSPDRKRKKLSPGVANMSMAQIINIKKQKLEEDKAKLSTEFDPNKVRKISLERLNIGCTSQNGSDCSVDKAVFEVGCSANNSNTKSIITNDNSKNSFNENGIKNYNNSISGKEIESDSLIDGKLNQCHGHSAGFDAFMTGYIFACDISTLGQLPDILSFRIPKELKFNHVVGKVYLIGKEFPFLVRSSSYNSTSANHDKLIKILRKR